MSSGIDPGSRSPTSPMMPIALSSASAQLRAEPICGLRGGASRHAGHLRWDAHRARLVGSREETSVVSRAGGSGLGPSSQFGALRLRRSIATSPERVLRQVPVTCPQAFGARA